MSHSYPTSPGTSVGASIATWSRRAAMPVLAVLAIAGGASFAVAQGGAAVQGTPAAVTAAPAPAATPALNIRQIYDRLESAGYRDIREIEWDDGRYEAKVHNAQGERLKLYVNATTGAVEHSKLRH